MTTATLKPLPMAELPLQDGVPPPHLVAPLSTRTERLASLDIFRGITIAAMLLVNNQGGPAYQPLRHVQWHGWTMTDLIFPFFLFIVGVAIPFSLAKRSSSIMTTRGQLLAGIWTRALSLVLLGLLLNAVPIWTAKVPLDPNGPPGPILPDGYNVLTALRWTAAVFVGLAFIALLFPWKSRRIAMGVPLVVAVLFVVLYWAIFFATRHALASGLPENFQFGNAILTPWRMRFPGVLQRIGICYGVAASIALFAGWRTVLASAVLLMTVYSALMLKAPFEGHVTGALEEKDNFARKVDEQVFGYSKTGGRNHNYGYPDPEGLVSTLPAIASVLLGILVGMRLRTTERSPAERCASVLAWGVAVTCLGVLLGWWLMPINKQIWTPSFTVLTTGLGMLGLGAVYYLADVRGRRAWALPFTIYGMNAIAAFVLAGLMGRLLGLIRFDHPRIAKEVTTPLAYMKGEITYGMHELSGWLAPHAAGLAAAIDTKQNVSLAYSLAFVLIVLIVMSVLYVCRVFIKV
ncbi:MAG: DUF5009 domain-containing protein [Tepidisphaeraceae bacterium]